MGPPGFGVLRLGVLFVESGPCWGFATGRKGKRRFEGLVFRDNMGMGQHETTRGPQILVHVSIHQGSVLGTYF